MFADDAEKSLVCWLKELLMKVVGVLRRENMDVERMEAWKKELGSGGAFCCTPPCHGDAQKSRLFTGTGTSLHSRHF